MSFHLRDHDGQHSAKMFSQQQNQQQIGKAPTREGPEKRGGLTKGY